MHQLTADWPIRHDAKPELDTNSTVATRVPARYVEAAVGRRISRRWALNSRFCRAMKMSRLINTSGSRSRSHSRYSVSLLPPPVPPPLHLSPPRPFRPTGETSEALAVRSSVASLASSALSAGEQ